jgi:hypothetical protein
VIATEFRNHPAEVVVVVIVHDHPPLRKLSGVEIVWSEGGGSGKENAVHKSPGTP